MSSPKPGHTTSRSGRGARPGGGAGPGRTGRRQNSSPRRQASLVPLKASKIRFLNVSPEARTSKIPCNPKTGTKPPVDRRFVSGVKAVSPRDERGSLFLAADQWTDAFLSLFMQSVSRKIVGHKLQYVPSTHKLKRKTWSTYSTEGSNIRKLQANFQVKNLGILSEERPSWVWTGKGRSRLVC